MRKAKYAFIAALAAVCIAFTAFAAVGCGGSTLEVDTSGTVTIFAVGDEFSSDGIVVYEKQSDGKNVRVPRDGYTISEPDMSTAGEKTVTITAGDVHDLRSRPRGDGDIQRRYDGRSGRRSDSHVFGGIQMLQHARMGALVL